MAVASFIAVLFLVLCIPSGAAPGFSGELIHTRAAVQHRSAASANYSNSRILSAMDRESIYLKGFTYNGTYVVKLRIGTPPQIVFARLSTTATMSDVLCYPLVKTGKSKLFFPNASTTYSTIPCISDSCESLRRFPCDSEKNLNCRYKVKHGKLTTVSGYLSNETLHFKNEDGGIVSVPGILLGCTHKIKPSPEDEEDGKRSVGYLSLSNNRLSALKGIHYSLGVGMPKKFSYCLPFRSRRTSKVYFGETPPSRVDNYTTTPLYIRTFSNAYYLNLMSIVVRAGEYSRVHTAVTGPQSRHEGNILVDSGTPITFLDDIYMETAILDLLDHVPRKRVEVPKGLDPLIKHCFDWSKPDVDVLPLLEFNFENQAIITGNSLLEKVKNGVLCLLVASAEFSLGVQSLGSGGQTAHRLEFDLVKKKMIITEDFCADR